MSNKAVMKQDAKPGLTPKLRFPEFQDGPIWKDGKVGELVSTVTPPKKLPASSYLEKGSFPIIDQSQREICGWTNDDKAVIAAPLPLIIFGDHTCALKFIARPFAQGADGIKILNARHDIGNEYLFHFLNFQPVVTEEYKRHFSILQEKRVSYPDIKTGEQQKIADCLTTLDEVIAAEARKLDALKTHKKGLMQQLFPREGETLPRLRFAEFQDAPEWVEIPIGQKVKLLSGYPFDGADILEARGGKRLLRGINITEGVIRHGPSIDRYFHGETEQLERYLLQENDLVIGMDGSKVGKNSSLISPLDSGSLLIQRVARLRTGNPILIKFIFQQINSPKFHVYVDRINTSSGIPHISAKQIQEFQVCFPSDEEQAKVVGCLTSFDDLITAQTAKLEALKTHKKGLMRQLFPSPEVVEA